MHHSHANSQALILVSQLQPDVVTLPHGISTDRGSEHLMTSANSVYWDPIPKKNQDFLGWFAETPRRTVVTAKCEGLQEIDCEGLEELVRHRSLHGTARPELCASQSHTYRRACNLRSATAVPRRVPG